MNITNIRYFTNYYYDTIFYEYLASLQKHTITSPSQDNNYIWTIQEQSINFHAQYKADEDNIVPMDIDVCKSEPSTIIVDGLNFFCAMNKVINVNPSKLGYMDIDRLSESHQFDCQAECRRAFAHAKDFFADVFPFGSKIKMVFKQFLFGKEWDQFMDEFSMMFFNDTNHRYTMYIALPADKHDTECDDRLVSQLALSKQAKVLTNDKYRSMQRHWHKKSKYIGFKKDRFRFKSANKARRMRYNAITKLERIGFDFDVQADITSDVSALIMRSQFNRSFLSKRESPKAMDILSKRVSQTGASDTPSKRVSQTGASDTLSKRVSQTGAMDTLSKRVSQTGAMDTVKTYLI